jgi:hypothetical protein
MAERESPAGYSEPLGLASAIISSTDRPSDVADPRGIYGPPIRTMRDLAEANLARADGSTDYMYCLQILMAFENVPVLQTHLGSLANGEVELECPHCGEGLLVGLGEPDYRVRPFHRAHNESPTPLRPASPNDLDRGASRAHDLATAHGQLGVAEKMLYLLGRATCPCCEGSFSIQVQLQQLRSNDE